MFAIKTGPVSPGKGPVMALLALVAWSLFCIGMAVSPRGPIRDAGTIQGSVRAYARDARR